MYTMATRAAVLDCTVIPPKLQLLGILAAEVAAMRLLTAALASAVEVMICMVITTEAA